MPDVHALEGAHNSEEDGIYADPGGICGEPAGLAVELQRVRFRLLGAFPATGVP